MPLAHPKQFAFSAPGPLRLYSTEDLLKLPPPSWAIDNIIPLGGFGVIYGPSGTGKSFVGIDMALSISAGIPWQDHSVRKGFALYVSAEGMGGLGQRALAWLKAHHCDAQDVDIAWITEAVPIYHESDELNFLFERFDEIGRTPDFIVVDTLARCFEGDENQQEPMGEFVRGIDRLRNECGATVMVVHHTGVAGERERGNTALRGAADSMIKIQPGWPKVGTGAGRFMPEIDQKDTFLLRVDKQREADADVPGWGHRVKVPGTTSCIPVIARWRELLDVD